MDQINLAKINEVLQLHLDGTAAPVYITKGKQKTPIEDAFAQLCSDFKVTTENEKNLIIYYLLSNIQLRLTERKIEKSI